MKKFIYFTVVLNLCLTVWACSKEIDLLETRTAGSRSDMVETDTLSAFRPTFPKTPEDASLCVGYAFSGAMEDNPQFRVYLKQRMDNNGIRFRELLIGQVRHESVGNQTVDVLLNQELSNLPVFQNQADPLATLLELNPWMVIKIPDMYVREDWNAQGETLPVRVPLESKVGEQVFLDGEYLVHQADTLLGLIVKNTEFYFAIRKSDGRNWNGQCFQDQFFMEYDACPAVVARVQSLADYPYLPGYVMAHVREDIQDVYAASCGGTSGPGSPGNQSPQFDCPRAEFTQYYSGNTNLFHSFRLEKKNIMDLIDNQPCPATNQYGYQEEGYHFLFNWVSAEKDNSTALERKLNLFCQVNELLSPGQAKFKYKQVFSWKCLCFKLVKIQDGWKYNGDPVDVPVPFPYPIFSANPEDNSWKPDKQGNQVLIEAIEIDDTGCTNSTQKTETFKVDVNLGVSFGIVEKNGTGKIGVNWGKTQQYNTSYTIVANSTVMLGNTLFGYCQEYIPGTENTFQQSSTGTLRVKMYCPAVN